MDFNVTLVFILTLASLALCVVYGAMFWNKDDLPDDSTREQAWNLEEKKIEEELSGEGAE